MKLKTWIYTKYSHELLLNLRYKTAALNWYKISVVPKWGVSWYNGGPQMWGSNCVEAVKEFTWPAEQRRQKFIDYTTRERQVEQERRCCWPGGGGWGLFLKWEDEEVWWHTESSWELCLVVWSPLVSQDLGIVWGGHLMGPSIPSQLVAVDLSAFCHSSLSAWKQLLQFLNTLHFCP